MMSTMSTLWPYEPRTRGCQRELVEVACRTASLRRFPWILGYSIVSRDLAVMAVDAKRPRQQSTFVVSWPSDQEVALAALTESGQRCGFLRPISPI
jgi:hypothetical protein